MTIKDIVQTLRTAVNASKEGERKALQDRFCHRLLDVIEDGRMSLVINAEYVRIRQGNGKKWAGQVHCASCGDLLGINNPPYFVGPVEKGASPYCDGCSKKEAQNRKTDLTGSPV